MKPVGASYYNKYESSPPHALNAPRLAGGVDSSHNLDVQVLSLLKKSIFRFRFFPAYRYRRSPYNYYSTMNNLNTLPTLKSISRLIFPISLLMVV